MIWPWSKIRALEARIVEAHKWAGAAEGRANALERALEAERERCDRLMAQIVEMRREGFNPAPAASSVPVADDLPPEVRNAIRERAGKDARLASELYEQAQADLAREMRPEDVAQAILKGGDYDPWGE